MPAFAQDVPPYLVHQGRLMDAQNAPITGTQDLTFNLYAEETGDTSFWTETQTIVLTNGFYSTTLGQGQGLDLSQFNGATLYLGVTVAGEELTPRMALRSVPYAIKSGTSQNAMTADTAVNVTGDITPNSVTVGGTVIDSSGVTINGTTVIDGSGQWAGPTPVADYDTILNPPFTFDNLACANGDVAQFVGGAWTCTPASSADTLSGLGCLEGQTAKFIAGAWACADDIDTDTDTDTTYTAGTGITIGAANDISVNSTLVQSRIFGACLAGESINTINADGSVVCEPDTDTDTTYTAGTGLTLNTTQFNVDSTYVRAEAVTAMGAKANSNALNHDRYTNAEAVGAMGPIGNGNPLNHDRYTNAEAVGAMGAKANANALNHDRYTNAEAVGAMGAVGNGNPLNHNRYTDAEAITAMGAKANANALNHDRYTNAEAVGAMGAVGNGNPLNHNRYTDAEAVTAMGAKANTNALNHDRYTDAEALAASRARGYINYTACSTDNDNSGDSGTVILNCAVNKRFDDSVLRVTYSDNLRTYGHGGTCIWEVEFDSQRCSAPTFAIRAAVYNSSSNDGGDWNNDHQARSVTGVCQTTPAGNLNAGVHDVRVRISYGDADCHTGWNQTSILLVEEIRP